ncbi:MAG: dihydroneopterin aldolase [Schleiferiaceae bacterium]|jgi:dihydroneopterin aldolase|nr:dihydroneopterin aldolase [Schleiferiaceae bacterium]
MDKIHLEGVKLYAYHGCMDEESRIGSDYEVELKVWADLQKSAGTDRLKDTVDYVLLNRIITEEMAIRAKLLEVVAQRIIDRIFKDEARVKKAEVKVTKMAPPINGDVERVSVILKQKRKK